MRQLLKDDSGFVMLQGTTYWTDLFVRHFLFQNESTIDGDDLLFFVRKKHVKGSPRYLPKFETEVDVFRKDSRKLPIGDPDIDWEETVYLNLIIHQFEYTLTLAICTRTSPKQLQVLKRHSQKVYASPSRRRMDTKGDLEEITYPHICFMVDNFDEVFCDILVRDGEMVCVELVASDREGIVQGVIFLGSIRYDALKKVYDARVSCIIFRTSYGYGFFQQSSLSTKMAQRMTFGLFSNSTAQRCEFVRMKGPQGKGHAEMAVTKPKGSGAETPSSEPGFCATDMWDSDWDEDADDFFLYRNQRRLSDPSSNLNNFVRGSWKSKLDMKSRSENEGLDCIDNDISEIEAGDVRDVSGPASASKGGCCGCFRRHKRESIALSDIYCRLCSSPTTCIQRAPLGPLEDQCICNPRHNIESLLNQSDYELGKEQMKTKSYTKIRDLRNNANFAEFEFADDAISLNGDAQEDRPSSRTSNASAQSFKDTTLTENPYINVNGKEELPCSEEMKKYAISNDVSILPKQNVTDASNDIVKLKDIDIKIIANNNMNTNEKETGNFDSNYNKLAQTKHHYYTLPKQKIKQKFNRHIIIPPQRITPDGTHIYYWCDVSKKSVFGCQREPSVYHSRVAKTPGDNGYYIKLQDDIQKYVPGEIYTGYLLGSRTFSKVQHFRRFTLNIESNNEPGNISPQKVGTFQLFGDNLSKFNENCVNTLSETSNLPKTEISFIWTAPPPGSGCVTFRAMVLEDPFKWYADDGRLNKIVCELTENDKKLDADDCCACDEAKYNLIFEGIWSNKTHPKDFPFSLWLTHFSDVIGASHERGFSFWGEGHIATDGFRSLAEWGSVRLMESELRSKSKHLRTIVKAAGLWYPRVNTNTSTNFKVDRQHHLVSLASMFGPSPDWVVGVNGLNLCRKDCTWIEDLTIDLYPWDAGTDSGITYMSPNLETSPKEKMYRITTMYPEDPRAPFYDPTKKEMHPMARFYFKREKVIPKGCDETFLTAQLDVSENTEDTNRPECGVTEYTAWSDCSVTCGKGLRMRTREYLMPQKAQMFQCNRQLVSKEMCVATISECEGGEPESEEQLEKNEGVCATTPWSSWTECSSSCGVGFISRSRHFVDRKGRKKCPHVQIFEREKCMGPPCLDDDLEVPDPMCPVTTWSDWGPCSATCGKGVKLRTRLLLVDSNLQEKCSSRVELVQQKPCVDVPDCVFDMATAKEVCMQPSEGGYCNRHYNRWYFEPNKLMCVPFVYSGCGGNRNNFLTVQECNEGCKIVRESVTGSFSNPQPIFGSSSPRLDCMVTEWSDWSPCSANCGPGISEKIRMIKRPAENGGRACPQRLEKKRKCNIRPCN
ncbi:hypothetical protein FQA39_LY08515 [Lamprigera yunnana]|nr:hypothetical protein FQA39_LY08515 [Lamprigera yunnana]